MQGTQLCNHLVFEQKAKKQGIDLFLVFFINYGSRPTQKSDQCLTDCLLFACLVMFAFVFF